MALALGKYNKIAYKPGFLWQRYKTFEMKKNGSLSSMKK